MNTENTTNNIIDSDNNKEESLLVRWCFRVFSVLFIIVVCILIIKLEFSALKKNKNLNASSISLINGIESSSENISNAWNKIYYFYQTGDLMNIIKCPSAVTKDKRKQSDLLLSLYREDVETRQNVSTKNMLDNFQSMKNIRCGGKVSINIGMKSDVYKHPTKYDHYVFKLGEEPIELLKEYPFVKNALSQIREGERLTFVAMPTEKNSLMPKKQIIYEIEIPNSDDNDTIQIPFYSVLNKSDDKFLVENQITCGSVVDFNYVIYDISGKKLTKDINVGKIKVGNRKLNIKIEQLMMQMSVGDHYMIFLPNNFLKQNEFFNKELLKNEVLLFEIKITNVHK